MLHQPTECAQNVCSASKQHQELSHPRALRRERGTAGLAHSVTRYHRLLPSPSCMSPATWEVKAESKGQMGEANENFSILFLSLGRYNRNPLMIASLTENVVEITPKHLYYCLSSKITLNSSVHRRAS